MQDHISESIAPSEELASSLRALIDTIRRHHPAPLQVPGLTTARFCALLDEGSVTPTHEESILLERLEHFIDRRVDSAVFDKIPNERQILDIFDEQIEGLVDNRRFGRMVNDMIDQRTESIGEDLSNDGPFIRAIASALDDNLDESVRDAVKAEYQSGDFDDKVEEVILDRFIKLLDQLEEDSLDALAAAVLKRIELRPRNSSAPSAT